MKKGKMKNLPVNFPINLASLLQFKKNQIISMALSDSDNVQISIFSFADNQSVSEESYLGDTMYLMIEGETMIAFDDRKVFMQEGDVLAIPANVGHEIGGGKAFKMMQITLLEQ